jgi:outer membrane biosynthesis protein TonB
VLAITGKVDYFPFGTSCAHLLNNFPTTMATKKTASKTTGPTSANPEETPKPVAKKAARKTAEKKAPAKTATKTAAPAAAKKAPAKKAAAKPSLDVIARAAYLNYRRRVELGLPGDSHGDWLEAERQFSEPV